MTSTLRASRRTVGVLTAVGCALALSACSGSSDDSNSSGTSGSSGAVQEEGTFPQTVATKFGDVTVEEQPTRVVALGWGDAETALALGVQPVGASDWLDFGGDGVGPWMEGAYDSSPEIISTLEPEYEQIAALEPDLILDVRSSGDEDRHDKLSDIATTIGVPDGADSYLTPREEQVDMIATALGRPDAGEEITRGYDDMVAGIRDKHPGWADKTAATVALSSTGWGAYIRGSERYDTLLDLGFQENATLAGEDVGDTGFSVKLSDETLSKADSDLVVAFAVGVTPEDVEGNAAWQRLAATEEGHSFAMPKEISSAYALGSPSAIEFALKRLVPLLEEHTDA
ncbi:iron-siderophore ABC transporter substrate-binding protein [Corynebacterium sp.]|uniref:iron-siderophore ABC transporter substrate-binding protein n=1 Tax=Corynebacterium sp. TaxID=1720 RepID=UPI003B3A657F